MNHFCMFTDRRPDAFQVKAAVRQQIHLPVCDTILCQTSFGGPDTNDFFQSIVWLSGNCQQLVART